MQIPTAFAASVLFALGGYPAVGWASVAVCLAAAALALRFPEAPREADDGESLAGTLRAGVREAAAPPGAAAAVLAVALVGGLDAVEEYFPVLAGDWGVAGDGRPVRRPRDRAGRRRGCGAGRPGRAAARPAPCPWLLVVAGLLLAAAALVGPAGGAGRRRGVLRALPRGAGRGRGAAAGPHRQRHRATITSVAGLGIELASLLVFAAWALGGAAAVAVLVLAVVPVVRPGCGSRCLGAARCR